MRDSSNVVFALCGDRPHRSTRIGTPESADVVVSTKETPVAEREGRFEHVPVMVDQVRDLIAPVPSGLIVDATLGGGRHAEAILEARPDCSLLGVDRDPSAIESARERLAHFADRVELKRSAFSDVASVVGGRWIAPDDDVVAFLFDLGVSSHQIDRPERGFSYRFDGPLDMRMDPSLETSASDLVNGSSDATLTRMFAANGEGRLAGRIARAIVAARPIDSTRQLADIVEGAVPAAIRRRGHPAARVFQALRIAVNDELVELAAGVSYAIDEVAPGGVVIVIAYHSGEDRIVKDLFVRAERGGCACPTQLPCVCGARPAHERVRRSVQRPDPTEVDRNPRASAARLRALRVIGADI